MLFTISPIRKIAHWVFVLSLLASPSSLRAEDEAELLALVRVAYQSNLKSIQSLSCTVTAESGFPNTKSVSVAKYWRWMDRARLQQTDSTGTVDYYFKGNDSEVLSVIRNPTAGGKTTWGAFRQLQGQLAHPLDVWREIFLGYDRMLTLAKHPPRAARDKVDGRNCIRVAMTCAWGGGDEMLMTYWFDAERNYLARRWDLEFKGERTEVEIVDFIEHSPGMFFPTKRASKRYAGLAQKGQGFFTLSDIHINEPIDKSLLDTPRVPSGTLCNDLIQKLSYPIDENWQRIPGSQAQPFDLVAIGGSSPAESHFTAQSVDEPWDWTYWIAPAALAVLALAASLWVYRRYRSRLAAKNVVSP